MPRFSVFLVLLVSIVLPCAPSTAATLPSQRATAQTIGRLTESGRVHALVVGFVTPAGQAVYGFGRRGESRLSKVPDGKTVFEIGSITKTFTGLLLAQAVMEGKLRTTDPIRRHLPPGTLAKDSPLYWISYLDLATHSSGLPEVPSNLPSADPRNPMAGYSTELLLNYLSTATLVAPIGQVFNYSNAGAGLCGYLLARLAETDYETLVRAQVCEPLGLGDTRITLTEDMAARMTHGHDARGQVLPNWEVKGLEGAGALRSTADDLLTYAAANLGIVPTPHFPAMKLAQLPRKHVASIPTLFLGLFWNIMNFGGKEYVLHAGRSGGYFALLLLSPEDNAGIVLLSDTEGDFSAEGWKLLSLVTGKNLP
jgi:CubicO group peptidase (beta-lactamase class C family)